MTQSPPALLPTFAFDASELPEAEQFDAFAAHVANSRCTRPVDGGPFLAKVRFWMMDPLLISDHRLGAFSFERDEAMVRATPADHYSLVVLLDGAMRFPRPGGDLVVEAPGASLTDLRRPETMHATENHTIQIQIARWFLDEALPPVDVHGPLPQTPAVKVLIDFVAALARQLPEMPATSGPPMARVIRDLLANALVGMPPRIDPTDGRQPVRLKVIRYIESQPMGRFDLDHLCHELGLSRASLARAFKGDGGVLAYDRRRRLLALHSRLSDATEPRSVAELGYAYGFPDNAHLSRVFRDTFGYAPSEVRRQVAGVMPHVAEPGSLADVYKTALRNLS
ncbi:AraC family transcriptional regulator [Phenylobacterium sp.]|uniref:AraC family transcriptional regulator n=1 Tax=Phenylobacterium sp. TaxID=1871053 RepID=UPI0025EE3347|nr:AraC family transcriptional regulator [Phenylobacterium sp.]